MYAIVNFNLTIYLGRMKIHVKLTAIFLKYSVAENGVFIYFIL